MCLLLEMNTKPTSFYGAIISTQVSPYPCKGRFSPRTHQAPSIPLRLEPSRYFAGCGPVAVAGSLQTVKMKKEDPLIVTTHSILAGGVRSAVA